MIPPSYTPSRQLLIRESTPDAVAIATVTPVTAAAIALSSTNTGGGQEGKILKATNMGFIAVARMACWGYIMCR
jgi:hypothetical protein